jgi:hypothetical protein
VKDEFLALLIKGMNFISRKDAKEQRRKVLDFVFSNFIPQFSNAEFFILHFFVLAYNCLSLKITTKIID